MGCMLDSDWSSQNLLHSDWLLPEVATITTLLCTNYIYIYIYIYADIYIYMYADISDVCKYI